MANLSNVLSPSDIVLVVNGYHKGKTGAVCGIIGITPIVNIGGLKRVTLHMIPCNNVTLLARKNTDHLRTLQCPSMNSNAPAALSTKP